MHIDDRQILLWVDDTQNPYQLDNIDSFSSTAIDDIAWVKSYTEFVDYIELFGLPEIICIDDDLSKSHDNDNMSGIDCMNWLLSYCYDNSLSVPECNTQSSNVQYSMQLDNILTTYKNNNS